jgi:hypothetical protein
VFYRGSRFAAVDTIKNDDRFGLGQRTQSVPNCYEPACYRPVLQNELWSAVQVAATAQPNTTIALTARNTKVLGILSVAQARKALFVCWIPVADHGAGHISCNIHTISALRSLFAMSVDGIGVLPQVPLLPFLTLAWRSSSA